MNLHNVLLTPPNLRLCYWHPDFVPECQIFHATKMTEQENQVFFALEDLLALEKHAKDQAEDASGDTPLQGVGADKSETLTIDGQSLRLKTGKKEKHLYFLDQKFLPEIQKTQFGLCNTQTRDGVPPKMAINRRDFLFR